MRERTAQPRRRKPSAARKLRPFWLLAALLAFAFVAAAYGFIVWPGFAPKSVSVEGNRVVSREDVLAAAQIDPARNMWLQNTRAMASRIDAIPYVLVARVHRIPPDRVAIDVTERVPYAILQAAGTRVTVDRTGRKLQDGVPPDLANSLPVFIEPGADFTALEAVADALLAAHVDPRDLRYDRYHDVAVTLRNGIAVLLGDQSEMLGQKIAMIEPILEKVDRGRRKVTAIDLRAPTTPVVVYAK
jgi:cell division septal protein FtsQ